MESGRGLRLAYTDAARRRWPLNTPLISLSMPVSTRPYPDRRAAPFFDGMLPEGDVRRMLAYDLAIPDGDTFGLLHALGRDCAGALVLVPVSAGRPPSPSLSSAEPVTDDEIARRLADLRTAPLGVDDRVRVSLPGTQGKLLLTRTSGSWVLPINGTPSTHILKPPIPGFDQSVENEAFCMRLATRLGLEAAPIEIAAFAGSPVLVVERFDRHKTPSGEIIRSHQEDVCQAMSVPVRSKYEQDGGPSLKAIATLLRRWPLSMGVLPELLRTVVFTTVIGDADRHGKNIAIVHEPDGTLRLAPLYDTMSTRYYSHVSVVPGMFINDVRDIDAVRAADFIAEAQA
ncbi:MAG: HipA domain-containing protein, partial [Acidimicrobiales bacterium]